MSGDVQAPGSGVGYNDGGVGPAATEGPAREPTVVGRLEARPGAFLAGGGSSERAPHPRAAAATGPATPARREMAQSAP